MVDYSSYIAIVALRGLLFKPRVFLVDIADAFNFIIIHSCSMASAGWCMLTMAKVA